MQAVLVTPRATRWDLELVGSGARPVPVEVGAAAYNDPRGRLMGIVTRLHETGERDHREALLRDSQSYHREMMGASMDSLYAVDLAGVISDANRAAELATGFTREQLLGTRFSDYFVDGIAADAALARTLAAGEAANLELALRLSTGAVRTVSLNGSVYRDGEGEVRGTFVSIRDVTEERRTEAELRASQSYHRGLIEASPDALFVVGSDMTIDDVNQQTLRVTGYSRAELIGTAFRSALHRPSPGDLRDPGDAGQGAARELRAHAQAPNRERTPRLGRRVGAPGLGRERPGGRRAGPGHDRAARPGGAVARGAELQPGPDRGVARRPDDGGSRADDHRRQRADGAAHRVHAKAPHRLPARPIVHRFRRGRVHGPDRARAARGDRRRAHPPAPGTGSRSRYR